MDGETFHWRCFIPVFRGSSPLYLITLKECNTMFFQMKKKKIRTCQELIHCLTRHIWNFKSIIKPREYFQLNISAKLLEGESWKVLLIIEISKALFKNIWCFVAHFTYDPVTWLFCISQRIFFFFFPSGIFILLILFLRVCRTEVLGELQARN